MKKLLPNLALTSLLSLSTIVMTVAVNSPVVLSQQLSAQEVRQLIKPVTVQIDSGTEQGTGVIIKKEGRNYTVLTNSHVIHQDGEYSLITVDDQKHQVQLNKM